MERNVFASHLQTFRNKELVNPEPRFKPKRSKPGFSRLLFVCSLSREAEPGSNLSHPGESCLCAPFEQSDGSHIFVIFVSFDCCIVILNSLKALEAIACGFLSLCVRSKAFY